MTSFPSVGTPDGDIDPLQTLASDGRRFIFIVFLVLSSLGSRLCTPPCVGDQNPLSAGSAVTLQLVSFMAPMLKKKVSESHDGSLPAVRT